MGDVLFEYRKKLEVRRVSGGSSAKLVQVIEYPDRVAERVLYEGTETDCERFARVVMAEWGGVDQWREVK